MNMKNLTLLILMTAGLNSYQSHANSTEKYFIGKYEYIIPSSIRKWTDDDNSFNEFAGHVPDKKIPLTKTIKGYKTYCFSQAGVFLSDMLYNSEKVIFRTFDFCQEPMVNLILSESKKLTKPNFSHGLKLVKVSPKQYQSLAYLVLVDEKEKVIYTNNAIYFDSSKPFDKIFDEEDIAKPTGLGKLTANAKTSKYCFSGKNLIGLGNEMEIQTGFYVPFIFHKDAHCGELIVNKNGIKYQLKIEGQDFDDSEYDYGDGYHYKNYYYTDNTLRIRGEVLKPLKAREQ